MADNIWLKKLHLPEGNSAHNKPRITLMRGFFDAEFFHGKETDLGRQGRLIRPSRSYFLGLNQIAISFAESGGDVSQLPAARSAFREARSEEHTSEL